MKIVFCIPGRNFSGRFFKCWTNLIKYLESKEIEWELVNTYSPIVYQARLRCANEAMDKDYDYMMWIDSDIIFKPNDFEKLLSHEKDIVSGLYFQQNSNSVYDIPNEYACIGLDSKKLSRYDIFNGLVEVKANGMGWMLVKQGVFEKIDKPFDPEGLRGEDITFQMKALEQGFRSYVDPFVVVGHEKSFILN